LRTLASFEDFAFAVAFYTILRGEPLSTPETPDGAKLLSAESFGDTSFGLRHNALSPLETLAQSISTIAPSTTPPATIPLVFALAGQGTAIAYLIAMLLMVLVGLCIAQFARESSSPGSLYAYTRASLPPVFSALTAWALFFAYITTASAVAGGFLKFSYIFLDLLPHSAPHVPSVLLVAVAVGGSMTIAYRDIKVSAQLMLYLEGISVCLIAVVIALTLYRYGLHLDRLQFQPALLRGHSGRGVGLGVMLAIFSFVGFESATTLGAEAREPLRTIPRAVVQSALLSGVFFVLCCYGETLAFHGSAVPLDQSDSPMHVLAALAGVSPLGLVIDAGVLISTFAATLSCIIAASRVLLLMAHLGLVHRRLARTSSTHETPAAASIVTAVLVFLPTAALALHGVSGGDIYGWMGTLAVYGFLTAYGMAAVALFFHLRQTGRLTPGAVLLTAAAALAMLLAMASNLYPVPPYPLNYFPYLYAAYLGAALLWLRISTKGLTPIP
jgi:amino acid transporter